MDRPPGGENPGKAVVVEFSGALGDTTGYEFQASNRTGRGRAMAPGGETEMAEKPNAGTSCDSNL